eukprot:CAMPEP_0172444218 /NCGR_PEP_ID=MMETSP1065-20121228/4276_1 /TAXON_ID=265537 /ORGANISM="Amphiprora paludosa, Strain CCMP125" /LENGTH=273 /DNA_ID=CAMNT_0013194651 /DNA_START=94 /DNA_END=915 /DNA_ORIENTATION=-
MDACRTSSDSCCSTDGTTRSNSSSRFGGDAHPGDETMTIGPTSKASTSTTFNPNWIICGRGSRVSSNPGNDRFRSLVQERKEEYQSAPRREEKTRITMEIIQALTEGPEPCRFMLKDAGGASWCEVDMDYAKEKVSHALRSRSMTEEERQRRKRLRQIQHKEQKQKEAKDQQRQQQKSRKRRGPQVAPKLSPKLEGVVHGMIADQQVLLSKLIEQHHIQPSASISASSPVHSASSFSNQSPIAPSSPQTPPLLPSDNIPTSTSNQYTMSNKPT